MIVFAMRMTDYAIRMFEMAFLFPIILPHFFHFEQNLGKEWVVFYCFFGAEQICVSGGFTGCS